MKKIITYPNSTIMMIETNEGAQFTFKSALDKELFIKTHAQGTYTLYDNYAIVKRYIVIDTEGTGWVLTNTSGQPYEQCIDLIHHYL